MIREFEEIIVEYPPEDLCAYPEYKGKPYFSIKYKEGNGHFIGYGTYKPEVFSRFLRDYFMPSVTSIYRDRTVQDFVDKCRECGKQRWIPCSERLPDERKDCIVTFKDGYVDTMCYAPDLYRVDEYDFYAKKGKAGWYDYDSEWGYYSRDDVIAWMPLPEPYKEEREV